MSERNPWRLRQPATPAASGDVDAALYEAVLRANVVLASRVDVLRDAAQEYFEATLPLLNDYPLTDGERLAAWIRLRKTNAALRDALSLDEDAIQREGERAYEPATPAASGDVDALAEDADKTS